MSYTTDETAIKDLIIANLSGYNSSNTKCGEEDDAFAYAAQNGGNVCVLDYGGGDHDSQPDAFHQMELWLWTCVVTFYLQYNKTTIETDIRSLADNFMAMHRDNKKLSSGHLWRIEAARAYESIKRNDRSYVPVPFAAIIKMPI